MQPTIRHFSFDAWNTLMSANKSFARQRSVAIATAFNCGNYGSSADKYSTVKKILDTLAELEGFGAPVQTAWTLLRKIFRDAPQDQETLDVVMSEVFELFAENTPHVPQEVVVQLHRLKDAGKTVSILSNTNFIPGSVLMESVFDKQFGKDFFDFALFSDAHGLSKPNPLFFHLADEHIKEIYGVVDHSKIMHVGDNPICDVRGARDHGWLALHVTSPIDTAFQLMDIK